MPTQSNNLLLLDLNVGSSSRGSPVKIGAADTLDLTLTGFTVDATNVSIDGDALDFITGGTILDVQGPTINVGTVSSGDSANTNINIGHSASSIVITGANLYVDAPLLLKSAAAGIEIQAGENLTLGDVLTVDPTTDPATQNIPRMVKSDASTLNKSAFIGVVVSASISSGSNGYAATLAGSLATVTFKATDQPGVSDVGLPVFVSSTDSGTAQMSAPTSSGDVIYRIGWLASATAVTGAKYAVILAPQLIAEVL